MPITLAPWKKVTAKPLPSRAYIKQSKQDTTRKPQRSEDQREKGEMPAGVGGVGDIFHPIPQFPLSPVCYLRGSSVTISDKYPSTQPLTPHLSDWTGQKIGIRDPLLSAVINTEPTHCR